GKFLPARSRPEAVESSEKRLVEMKARYEDLGKARALLAGAEHVATVKQVDSYFALGERRLKLRSVGGSSEGQLIYYERPDVGGGKESRVLLVEVPDAKAVLVIIGQMWTVKVETGHVGEVYLVRAA